jgi:hypothetical protein
MLDKSKISSIFLTAIIAFFVFLVIERDHAQSIWGVSRDSWQSVATSILAAAIFLFIQWIITLLQETEPILYKNSWNEFVNTFGLKKIYNQRGSREIQKLYSKLIQNAKYRIWAFGMTNKHFVHQHKDQVLKKLLKQNIDVVIGFWDPNTVITNSKTQISKPIIDIQNYIENNTESKNLQVIIEKRQKEFIKDLQKHKVKGTLKIINISIPSNISCLIIDDDVFFFPFLSGPDSTNDPIINCCLENGIGKSVFEHFDQVLKKNELFDTVFEQNKGLVQISTL